MRSPRPRLYPIALWIDRWIGTSLCALLLVWKRLFRRSAPPLASGEVRRVLLLKMWGMGSIVLATPLVRRLGERFPEARVDLLTLRENRALAELVPGVDRVLDLDLRGGIPSFLVATARTILGLRRERYDLLLDLEFFTRFSALFSFLARPRRSHGFSAKGKWRGMLHDVQVPFNAYNHVALNFLDLLQGDPMDPVPAEDALAPGALPALDAPPKAWDACRRAVESDPAWLPGRPVVVVNPNAGDMALERRWPREQAAELLRHLCATQPVNVVLTGSASERAYVESVVDAAGVASRAVNLAGQIGIAELVALLAHADVVVTNDSGPLHLACAAGASTVALFGPETPVLYGPLRSREGQRHAVHYLKLACSPCMFVHDNKVLSCWFAQAKCMTGIAPAAVLASVEELLDARGRAERPLRVLETPREGA